MLYTNTTTAMWLLDYIYEWRKYNYFISTVIGKYIWCKYWNRSGIWWNQIDPMMILGAIPLHNLNHMELLKKGEGVGAILSILEDFELAPNFCFQPVTKEDWEANGIRFLQVPAEDSHGVSSAKIQQCLDYIDQCHRDGLRVYVHCKAGKGRSASVVLSYLARHNPKPELQRMYAHLKSLREEVDLNQSQWAPIYDWLKEGGTLPP